MSYLEDIDFHLAEELRAPVFRDWGIHFKHQDEMQKAIQSFERSIEANPKIYKSLLEHSICKLKMHRPDEALESAKKCLELFPNSVEAKHVYDNSMYELNRLENALKMAHNTFHEHPKDHLGDVFINSVKYSLEQGAGPEAGSLLRLLKHKLKKEQADDNHASDDESGRKESIWAEVPEVDCDVISVCEESFEELSPLERKRKDTIRIKRHEIYYDRMVRDQIVFWEKLKKHKAVNLTQSPHSCKVLRDIIDRCLERTQEYERMLYEREPLFVKRAAEKRHPKNARLVALYYMQQNTRREALFQLEKVKELKQCGMANAIAYVEKIMVEFYAVKSKGIFPRKYEFMSEIFNYIGIHILNTFCNVPGKLMDNDMEERLDMLMRIPNIIKSAPPIDTRTNIDRYGDRSAFNDPDYVDQTEIIFNKRTKYFEKRIAFSKDAIEKAYLNYLLSEHYLNSARFDEAQHHARIVVTHANQCKSNIWKFIGYLSIVRADTMKKNYRRITRNLKEMSKLASKLSKYVEVFVSTAIRSNEDIEVKRADNRRMSRMSRFDRLTISSRQSSDSSHRASTVPSQISESSTNLLNSTAENE